MATECANPLFLGWVKEWWDQAKERNTKGVLAYRNAHESLRACPIRFEHPDQLLALKGFGPKMCSRLLERLTRHCEESGLPVPAKRRLPRSSLAAANADASGSANPEAPARPARKRKPYVPALRQGGYAIVMALSSAEAARQPWLSRAEIVELAQPHCDASFTVKPPGKFYTAWDSIKTLLSHELVAERGGRPGKRYALTEDGWETARRLRHVVSGESLDVAPGGGGGERENADTDDLVPEGSAVMGDDGLPEVRPIVLPAGSYSVQLVLDTRERVTGQRTYMEDELGKRGVAASVRALSLGDAQWVAKVHDSGVLGRQGAEGDEVVLDWIVERKRQDDLVSSIRDGRFREQKYRLRRSGVRHVVYVVEESGLDADTLHRYEEAMQSAMAATQVVHGFFVKRTRSVDDSIAYLAELTRRLQRRYADRPLHVLPTAALTARNHLPLLRQLRSRHPADEHAITYAAFASLTSKSETLTLRDVFLKMLMCTRGVTGDRALEIQKRWRTPRAFVQAYAEVDGAGDEEMRKRKRCMVSDALGGLPGSKRRVTKAISEKLAEAWAEV